jgi:two-component system chemotaxis response regulator CheY
MKALIVDDEFTSRLILQKLLLAYGETHVIGSGKEAIDLFSEALLNKDPYDLVCLDIMMPDIDGQAVLEEIRALEDLEGIHGNAGVKIIMISALKDKKTIMQAFKSQCEGYLVKPIDGQKLLEQLNTFGLVG